MRFRRSPPLHESIGIEEIFRLIYRTAKLAEWLRTKAQKTN